MDPGQDPSDIQHELERRAVDGIFISPGFEDREDVKAPSEAADAHPGDGHEALSNSQEPGKREEGNHEDLEEGFPEVTEHFNSIAEGVADKDGLEGIELWFVRHGESTNNRVVHGWGGLKAVLYPVLVEADPLLTDKGLDIARENGSRLVSAGVNFDLVLCSALMRTMETAYEMFIKTGLTESFKVAPFVSEVPLTWGARVPVSENIPFPRARQIKVLRERHGDNFMKCVDWSLVGGPQGDNLQCLPPGGVRFLRWLNEQKEVLKLVDKPRQAEVVRIVVVTHSRFMRRGLLLRKKPGNSDVWRSTIVNGCDGSLAVCDIQPWYRSSVERKKKRIDRRIDKKRVRAQRKINKLKSHVSELQDKQKNIVQKFAARSEGSNVDEIIETAKDATKGSLDISENMIVGAASEALGDTCSSNTDIQLANPDGDPNLSNHLTNGCENNINTTSSNNKCTSRSSSCCSDSNADSDEVLFEDPKNKLSEKNLKKMSKAMRKLSKKNKRLHQKATKMNNKASNKISKLEAKKEKLDNCNGRIKNQEDSLSFT